MKIPIPDDFEGEELTCFKVYWPDSPLWIGILQGLIALVQSGRYWDEATGSIKSAQETANLISAACFPLELCGACPDSENGDGGSAETVYRYFGSTIDLEEDDMAITRIALIDQNGVEIPDNGDGIPVGIRWFYGECCYRDFIAGEGSGSVVVPPGEELPDFALIGTGTACSKITAWTNVLFAAVDSLLDDILVPESPDIAIQNVKALKHNVNWGDFDLLSAYSWAAHIHTFGYINETESERVQQNIKCALVDCVEAGSEGITKAQYDDMQSKLAEYLRSEFTIWTYPLGFAPMINIYLDVARSIGAGDTEKLTTGTVSASSDDCSCGGAPGNIQVYEWDYCYNFYEDPSEFTGGALAWGTWVSGQGFVSDSIERLSVEMAAFDNYTEGRIELIEFDCIGDTGDVGSNSQGLYITGSLSGRIDLITPAVFAGIVEGTHQVKPDYDMNQASVAIRFEMNMDNQAATGLRITRFRLAGSGTPPCDPPVSAC